MEKITFKGPFHSSKLKDEELNELNDKGIYIWGFMYEKDKDSNFGKPLHCYQNFNYNEMKFLPYYVGKTEKSLRKRLNEHFDIQNKKFDGQKYIRFSENYMKKFFLSTEKFPIKTHNGSLLKPLLLINLMATNIIYYNNLNFMKKIYGNKIKSNYTPEKINSLPISDFYSFLENTDTLRKNIVDNDNFWFCYANLDENIDSFQCKLKDYEVLTFYSLKGKTISKTEKLDSKISEKLMIINETDSKDIFKDDINTKSTIANHTKNGTVDFPGY